MTVPPAHQPINIRIDDLDNLNDAQLNERTSQAMRALATITAPIIKDGVAILLLEKNRRSVDRLHGSSKRLEWGTWILVGLTLVLTALTVALLCHGG